MLTLCLLVIADLRRDMDQQKVDMDKKITQLNQNSDEKDEEIMQLKEKLDIYSAGYFLKTFFFEQTFLQIF